MYNFIPMIISMLSASKSEGAQKSASIMSTINNISNSASKASNIRNKVDL